MTPFWRFAKVYACVSRKSLGCTRAGSRDFSGRRWDIVSLLRDVLITSRELFW